MDVISYSYADEQKKKIDKFIADPKNVDGIVTVPKTIHTGNAVTVPTGRQVVVRSLTVENGASVTIEGDGEIFVPNSGAGLTLPVMTTDSVKTQTTQKTIDTDDLVKQTEGIIQDIDGVALYADRGLKNKLINGGFDIWQRGEVLLGALSTGYHGMPDRWRRESDGCTVNIAKQKIDTINGKKVNSLQFGSLSVSGTYFQISQRNEDAMSISGKTVTLSFYMVASEIFDIDVYFGVYWGSGSIIYSSPITVGESRAVIRKYTVTYTFPDYNSETYVQDASYWMVTIRPKTDGTVSAIRIAQVQLEEGSVATPFEQRPIGLELSLCQRYYQATHYGALNAGSSGYIEHQTASPNGHTATLGFIVELSSPMRIAPTVTFYAQTSGTIGSMRNSLLGTDVEVVAGQINGNRFTPTNQSGATIAADTKLRFFYTADAEI